MSSDGHSGHGNVLVDKLSTCILSGGGAIRKTKAKRPDAAQALFSERPRQSPVAFKTQELLLPAGSLDKMRAACDVGAAAVYAGQPRYSLRARNNEFRLEQIQTGIKHVHG